MVSLAELLPTRGIGARIHAPRAGVLGSATARLGRGSGWAFLSQLAVGLERGATVHAHSVLTARPGFTLLETFARLLSRKSVRWLETIHDGGLPERFQSWPGHDRRSYVASLQQADCVIAVSQSLSEFLVDSGVAPSRVTTISPLLPSPIPSEDVANPIASFVASHHPVVLGVGAIVPHYDFRTLVACHVATRTEHPTAGLILLTSTFDRDEAYASDLERDLEPIREDVRVLVDVPSTVVRKVMQDADVVVRGPSHESFGLSRVEALLAGTPVVATAKGEQHFVIPYEFGDLESLRSGLNLALEQPPEVTNEARAFFQAAAVDNLDRIIALYTSTT